MNVLYRFVFVLAQVLNAAIIARILLSWIPVSRENRLLASIVELVHQLTEPILGPIRRLVPSLGGLDISPIIALILIRMLLGIAARLG